MFGRLILALSSLRNRLRKRRVPAKNILLLIPHCLQQSLCKQNIIGDIDQCAHCGKCNIHELIALRDELGVQCHLVGGGREAVARTKQPEVKIILAVACEKELASGIVAAFPKAVFAVPNTRPEGPCKNTRVDVDRVRQELENLIEK